MNVSIYRKRRDMGRTRDTVRKVLEMINNPTLKEPVARKVSASTRENAQAFGKCATAAKMLKNALGPLMDQVHDPSCHQRLIKELMKVIREDTTGIKSDGLQNGDLTLLSRFKFNFKADLLSRLFCYCTSTINRKDGHMTISIPSFDSCLELVVPRGATHYQFLSAGVGVDFAKNTFDSEIQRTEPLPVGVHNTRPVAFIHHVGVEDSNTLFLVVALKFYVKWGTELLPVMDKSFNPVNVVQVSNAIRSI